MATSKSSEDWKAKARAARTRALSGRTRAAYSEQWRRFVEWSEEYDETALPAEPGLVAAYLAARADAGWKVSSLGVALAAICHHHTTDGHTSPRHDPEFAETWLGLRKSLSARPDQKAPLSTLWLRDMPETLPEGLRGVRDRALLMVGFAGGFRRSELSALVIDDVIFHPQGVELVVRKSKTDQAGHGHVKVIAYGRTRAPAQYAHWRTGLNWQILSTGPSSGPSIATRTCASGRSPRTPSRRW